MGAPRFFEGVSCSGVDLVFDARDDGLAGMRSTRLSPLGLAECYGEVVKEPVMAPLRHSAALTFLSAAWLCSPCCGRCSAWAMSWWSPPWPGVPCPCRNRHLGTAHSASPTGPIYV